MTTNERKAVELILKRAGEVCSPGYGLGEDPKECMRLMESPDYRAGLGTMKDYLVQYIGWLLKASPTDLARFVQSNGADARHAEHRAAMKAERRAERQE